MLFVNVDIPEAFTPTTDMLGVPVNPWARAAVPVILDEVSAIVPAEFGKTTVGLP